MEVTGKIIQVLPETSGVSKAGKAWKKREYVLEYQDGKYPSQICFDLFGERADQYPLSVGQVIKLQFDLSSREYNGRWYTSVSGWRVDPADGTQNAAAPAPQQPASNPYNAPVIPPAELTAPTPTDDLPF